MSNGMTSRGLGTRIARVRENLARCTLCPRECRVDRLGGERGWCGLGASGRVFHHALSFAEEPEISPTYEILLSGCSHRCRFCSVLENVEHPDHGRDRGGADVREGYRLACLQGARTLSFVGGEPTVNLLAALELIEELEPELPVVWNSNMYMTPFVHEILDGVVSTFVGDVHFGNDACALEVGATSPYVRLVEESFERAATYASVIIRHLLVPGHVECCAVPVMRWARERLPHATFHLMGGYVPREGTAALSRWVRPDEVALAQQSARAMGLGIFEGWRRA